MINVAPYTGNGRVYQMLGELDAVTITHNTTFASTAVAIFGALPQATNFVFRDNISTRGTYGVFGTNLGEGTAPLNYYAAPGYVFLRNLIIGAPASLYPTGSFYPAGVTDVGFVDQANGNYRLLSTSSYAKQASDGRDPGADIDAVDRALVGVVVP
jgi:hypothetical protein